MHPGAKRLKIAVLNIGTLDIEFRAITPEIVALKPKMTYDLKIHVPQPDTIVELVEVKQTYEDLKKEARSMYGLRQSKNTTEFFEKLTKPKYHPFLLRISFCTFPRIYTKKQRRFLGSKCKGI